MNATTRLEAIIHARDASATTLLEALQELGMHFTEQHLADKWLQYIKTKTSIHPFGWYSPPPNGVSVLIGEPDDFNRLEYQSLRDQCNWPSPDVYFNQNTVLYPYFSAVDRATKMIGDHVATYYSGRDPNIRQWYRAVYEATRQIALSVNIGMTFSELHSLAEEKLLTLGAKNNTYSLTGGLAADIGHTIPYFSTGAPPDGQTMEDARSIASLIGGGREFISKSSEYIISDSCAFTIEPQAVTAGLPMCSFHMIVAYVNGEFFLIEKFKRLFEFFGMADWIYDTASPDALG
ncbi:hypothetical protein [Thiorhodococcus fuscus]|uniref:Peptidase M24 domain-containing protein n=1 Tax=Thiorhodococcus fuscus TaxID=527200 RepID=A0ABW4Y9L6_9GAMM